MRSRWGAAVLAAVVVTGAARAQAAAPSIDAQIAAGAQAFQAGDCAKALPLAEAAIAGPEIARVGADAWNAAYLVAMVCESRAGHSDKAYDEALAATRRPDADGGVWFMRAALEIDLGKPEGAVSFEHLVQAFPDDAADMTLPGLSGFADKLAGDPALYRRFLAAVMSDAYAPSGVLVTKDWIRLKYINLLSEAGETAAAAEQVHKLRTAEALAQVSVDQRYAPLFASDFDIRAAKEADLARAQAAISSHPDLLEPLNEAAGELRGLGRPQEALALLDQAQARIDAADHAPPSARKAAYADLAKKLNWLWDERARSLEASGRLDEAAAAFEHGALLHESGELNVSQSINLAEAYNRMGRGPDAVKALAVADDPAFRTSPYGASEMTAARGCGYALSGRAAEAAKALDYLKAHVKDHPRALTELLVCTGDLDAAAASVIARLADPARRGDALIDLCDYDDPPGKRPVPDLLAARWKQVRARPDVQAAAAKVGTLRRFHVQPPGD